MPSAYVPPPSSTSLTPLHHPVTIAYPDPSLALSFPLSQLVNRETESITSNARVQKYLEEAKATRKRIIRYIQLVEDEEYIGTLLQTNETIITSLQLYDRMAKPSTHDSDDEAPSTTETTNPHEGTSEEEVLRSKMAAQRLQDERETELNKLQAKQRAAVQRDRERRSQVHSDLQDLDFSGGCVVLPFDSTKEGPHADICGAFCLSSCRSSSRLPEPLEPRYDASSRSTDSLSDLSEYDSSDDDYQLRANSRRTSTTAYDEPANEGAYGRLGEGNLLDTPTPGAQEDPFADPFFGEGPATPMAKERKEWSVFLAGFLLYFQPETDFLQPSFPPQDFRLDKHLVSISSIP